MWIFPSYILSHVKVNLLLQQFFTTIVWLLGNEVAGEGNGFDAVLESKLRNLEQANLRYRNTVIILTLSYSL